MKTRCTMTELLSKITMLNKKISKVVDYSGELELSAIDRTAPGMEFRFMNIKKISEDTVSGIPVKSISDEITSTYDRVVSQIENYNKLNMIKNGVNSTVKIKVSGNEMTIAEALSYNKKEIRKFYEALIRKLLMDYNNTKKAMEVYNQKMFTESTINEYLAATLGKMDTTSDTDKNAVEDLTALYHKRHDLEFIDPLEIAKKIETLQTWYDDFYATIDFKLSEANSRLIVEYDLDENIPSWRIVNLDEIESLNNHQYGDFAE